MRLLRVLAPLAVVCGALFAASCGSNSSPSASATSYPSSASYSIALGTTGGTITLPTVGVGNTATLVYVGAAASPFPSPFPSNGVSLAANVYLAPPTNAPALTSKARTTLSKSNATVVMYVTLNFNTTMPASSISSEILGLASSMPNNVPYFVEFDDLTTNTYINTFPGTAASNGSTSFTNSGGFVAGNNFTNVSFASTDTYLMQFYYLGVGASPSPTPSGSPVPTPSPVVVSTTVPLGGSAQAYTLPVTSGGYVGTVTVPGGVGSGSSLTISGSSVLPSTVVGVGSNSADYPFYVVGLNATAAVSFGSPAISVQLPANFPMNYPIYAALCVDGTCPVANNGTAVDIPTTTSNGVVTVAANAISAFTGVSTQNQYVVFYSSRQTPSGNSAAPVTIPAGATQAITLPTISSSLGDFSSTLTIGGLGTTTQVTASSETGLFPGMSAIVPNSETIVYALSVIANPRSATAAGGYICGNNSCTVAVVTLPQAVVTNAANAGASFYVEECTQSACPVSANAPDVVNLGSPSGARQLTVPATFGTDIAAFDPVNAYYFVFYYQ